MLGRMPSIMFFLSLHLCLMTSVRASADVAIVGASGRLKAVSVGGERVPVGFNVHMYRPGWREMVTLNSWDVEDTQYTDRQTEKGREQIWTNRTGAFRTRHSVLRKQVSSKGVDLEVRLRISALRDADGEGVFLLLPFAVAEFSGGEAVLEGEDGEEQRVMLPEALPPRHHLGREESASIRLFNMGRMTTVSIRLDEARTVTVQDNRRWNTPDYSLFVPLHEGPLKKGEEVEAVFEIQCRVRGEPEPVAVRLEERREEKLQGFGGNFVYETRSPITAYNIETLKPRWGRCGMTLREWEPTNDNESPEEVNWEALRARDSDGSALRHEFELLKRLSDNGIPIVASVWRLPEWMYENPDDPEDTFLRHDRRVAEDAWEEMLESITTYLLHVKREYGVEPELFSFNEPDQGWHVRFRPREHAELIRRLGERFEQLGIKTRMMLGDCANADGSDYVFAATQDPQAMKHVEALSFHAWNSAKEEYPVWRRLADELRIPLMVSEAGVDPEAWKFPWMLERAHYAIDELRTVQELLIAALPAALMQWQFTSNYRMAYMENDVLHKTLRWTFWRHFCRLTPQPANYRDVSGGAEEVLASAFQSPETKHWTVHLANLGAERGCIIESVPQTEHSLYRVSSTDDERWQIESATVSEEGRIHTVLPARSLTTFTTLSPPKDQ